MTAPCRVRRRCSGRRRSCCWHSARGSRGPAFGSGADGLADPAADRGRSDGPAAVVAVSAAALDDARAALALGGVGYAWQGRPTLAASAPAPRPDALLDNDAISELRGQLIGRYGGEAAMFTAADALSRSGNKRTAVQIMLGAVGGDRNSVPYWTELAMSCSRMTAIRCRPPPASPFAAHGHWDPRDPTPFFFEGLAWMRAGDFRKARCSGTVPWRCRPPMHPIARHRAAGNAARSGDPDDGE